MIESSKIIFVFVTFTRLTGIFPYSLKISKTSPGQLKLSLKRSILWVIWSTITTLFIVIVMTLDVCDTTDEFRRMNFGYKTTTVIEVIHDAVAGFTVLFLQVVCLAQSAQMAKLLLFAASYDNPNYSIISNKRNSLLVKTLPLVLPSLLFIYYTMMPASSSVIETFVLLTKVSFLTSYTIIIAMMYHSIIEFIARHLREILNPLMKNEDMVKDNRLLREPRGKSTVSSKVKVNAFCCCKRSRISDRNLNLNSASITVQEKYLSTRNSNSVQVASTISNKLVSLFEIHRMTNKYMDLPLTSLLLFLIIWLIKTIFNVTMWKHHSPTIRLTTVMNLIITLFLVVFVSNSTQSLITEVTLPGPR